MRIPLLLKQFKDPPVEMNVSDFMQLPGGNARSKQNTDHSTRLICPQTQDSAGLKWAEAVMQQLARSVGRKNSSTREGSKSSQDTLALVCKVDRSYMGRIERGEVNITVEKLYKIAATFKCESTCLLSRLNDDI